MENDILTCQNNVRLASIQMLLFVKCASTTTVYYLIATSTILYHPFNQMLSIITNPIDINCKFEVVFDF